MRLEEGSKPFSFELNILKNILYMVFFKKTHKIVRVSIDIVEKYKTIVLEDHRQ